MCLGGGRGLQGDRTVLAIQRERREEAVADSRRELLRYYIWPEVSTLFPAHTTNFCDKNMPFNVIVTL
jgi:hypothetical protein